MRANSCQIGCYIMMSVLKTLVTAGLQFIPGVGKVLDSALGQHSQIPQT